MRFRPCIDIHNGQVKQIVGGSLADRDHSVKENFISLHHAEYFARMYRKDGLQGGHVILLNPPSSVYYEQTKKQAVDALSAYPGGLQIGGGVTPENAEAYLDAGASHVIVTSYVFREGKIHWEHMEKLRRAVGKERVVMDLSCRKKKDAYYIVTDRWQNFTDVRLCQEVLQDIAMYCDEFLIHGVDVEGKASGIDETLAEIIGNYARTELAVPVTYAGGIGSMEDIERFRTITKGLVDFTAGSALDLFGGILSYHALKKMR